MTALSEWLTDRLQEPSANEKINTEFDWLQKIHQNMREIRIKLYKLAWMEINGNTINIQ